MSIKTAIQGITVELEEKTQTGSNSFNEPIYTTSLVSVDNVLVEPVSTTEILSDTNLEGKRQEARLCIPKGNSNNWENTRVHFWGATWETYGYTEQWIDENVPLLWNKKVKVKRLG